MIKLCEQCNKEYKVRKSRVERSKYCNKDCQNVGQKGKYRTPSKRCPQCTTEFRPTNKIQTCCSFKCNSLYKNFEPTKEKICNYCTKTFYSTSPTKQYCNANCYMIDRMSSEEERQKISDLHKGKVSWNRGLKGIEGV